jgi:hypothetical protein
LQAPARSRACNEAPSAIRRRAKAPQSLAAEANRMALSSIDVIPGLAEL